MQFMGNVNKLSRILIFFLILSYIFYLFYDNKRNKSWGDRKTYEIHMKNIKKEGSNINALILGGSNAVWGLSAKILTEKTKLNYYNFSIVYEGRNNESYNQFINELSQEYLNKNQIQQVIYSSIAPFHKDIFREYTQNKIKTPVWGNQFVSIKPFSSYYQYVKEKYYLKQKLPDDANLVDSNGDLRFFNQPCPGEQYHYYYNMANAKEVAIFLNQKADFLTSKFPNAQVNMVIPSEYIYMARYPREWVGKIVFEFQKNMHKKQRIIVQEQIPELNLLCSGVQHPNEKGREWRTNRLIQSLQSKEAISF